MAARKKTTATRGTKAKAAAAVADVAESSAVPVRVADPAPAAAAPALVETVATVEARPARKGKTMRYLLPANMEIAALGPVHEELVALEASNDGPFILDGANLSVIDTAGLQLLISFVSAVQSSGKKVTWDNYSVQAYQLANELGLVDQLGD